MKKFGSASDPLWYKDAIVYELHVRTFFDANNDGIGDFRGLIQKLDYLSELGITCIWLLPFFPSPLRDDGYDIADYRDVHASYGTLADFREFLDAAHVRGMQVLIELVINHTSDQHPWFQLARRSPPGSPERDFYVWSETDERYKDARIIFTDTEKSNWTWDPEAKAYFWHRFFSHQPDLNFDNPVVIDEVVRVMRFWLDMGVDALRLDAIPYLIERDGTNCENLDETHVIIKRVRAELDAEHGNRSILAEANQWPADVRAYFGEGDECHMAFHFPLMPRLFMGLRLEDRHPVVEIMRQTPAIPDSCQWGLFLRNHDELTLEMVTSDERDYMYLAYSIDPRMRVNVGIRRRLAPLLENNVRRIELLNSILLSFPGTPFLYYGDEIGMGDNIYLGDRNGVRTPMQWSADRNAGFSRVNPERLYSPVIMDPVYGYEAINVEAQQGDPSSLLNWMTRMIALRKLFHVFGRGTIEFLEPGNRKILAYLRTYGKERVLCVANLSRFAQPFDLDLSTMAGTTPVEMLGYVEFPRITRAPYPLTLGPYGFLWFELHGEPEPASPRAVADTLPSLVLSGASEWSRPFRPGNTALLELTRLPEFLVRQRWFDGKERPVKSALVEEWITVTESLGIALVGVDFVSGQREIFAVPLALAMGTAGERLREENPAVVLCMVTIGSATGVVHDAMVTDEPSRALLSLTLRGDARPGTVGALAGVPSNGAAEIASNGDWSVHRPSGDQRNSSIVFGDRLILKLFRRLEYGPNPDYEMTHYLSERHGYDGVPQHIGRLEYRRPMAGNATVAFVERFVHNQGDGWQWVLDELGRYYERVVAMPADHLLAFADQGSALQLSDSDLPPELADALGFSDDAASALGKRTAQMHLVLAEGSDDPSFAPERVTNDVLATLAAELREQATRTFVRLRDSVPNLPDDVVEAASRVLSMRSAVANRLGQVADLPPEGARIRVHGDYHLGQVLRVGSDFVVIDFEGEPSLPLPDRRKKHIALRDVASMLRSFSYAARVALSTHMARRPGAEERVQPWVRLWERSVHAAFLRSYRLAMGQATFLPRRAESFSRLLDAFLLDKALYELRWELEHRPSWIRVPLAGILELGG